MIVEPKQISQQSLDYSSSRPCTYVVEWYSPRKALLVYETNMDVWYNVAVNFWVLLCRDSAQPTFPTALSPGITRCIRVAVSYTYHRNFQAIATLTLINFVVGTVMTPSRRYMELTDHTSMMVGSSINPISISPVNLWFVGAVDGGKRFFRSAFNLSLSLRR